MFLSCYRPKEFTRCWDLEPSGIEVGFCPSAPGVGWFPTLLWPSRGLIGQNASREDSVRTWGAILLQQSLRHRGSAMLGNSHLPPFYGRVTDPGQEVCLLLAGRGRW